MANIHAQFAKHYMNALKDYLEAGQETSLEAAYTLGRRALDRGLGILDIVAFHQQASLRVLPTLCVSDELPSRFADSLNFFAEALSPFEMAQRGFQDSVVALKTLNEQLEAEVESRTRALKESEAQYRNLVEISPDAITVTELNGIVLLCNQQAAEMYGYGTPEELIGQDASRFVAPEDMGRVQADGYEAMEVGIIRNREFTLIKKDGTRFPVEVNLSLIRDAAGKPGAFVAIARDITGRKLTALQRAAVAELGQRALAGASLNELMDEAVTLVASMIGVEFCELLELSPDGEGLVLRAGLGWKEGLVGTAKLNGREDSQAAFALLRAGPVVLADLRAETRFKPAQYLLDHDIGAGMAVAIRGKSQPYGILGAYTRKLREFTKDEGDLLQSVTNVLALAIENLRLIETEAGARREAERANDLKLKFLAMISHELRTPLTSIKGFATTLLAEDVSWDATAQRDFIQTINDEADKLSELIEQLLDLSRLEAGTLRIVPSQHRIENVLDEVMAQLRELTRDHSLTIDIPTDLPTLHVDSLRIGQVIANLVENAAKYSPAGTPIHIKAHHVGSFVRIEVADQGPGIPVGEQEKVFEMFHRAASPTSLARKGAGLGLAICLGLVQAHGGRIWVEDQDGPGTVIAFTVPASVVPMGEGNLQHGSYHDH